MSFEPKIVGFVCTWCTYTGADLAGGMRLPVPDNVRLIRAMCSSRIDPVLVLRALLDGADGVLVGGCHPGDCHYQQGNYYTRRRIVMLHSMLRTLGLEPERVRLAWISAAEGPRFSAVTNEFTEEIRQLGPNPLRTAKPQRIVPQEEAAAGGTS
jgi:F420-non-reducing hydrogenase iron-sulfur subunit